MNSLELLASMHVRALPRHWDQPVSSSWVDVLANVPLFKGVSKRRLRALSRSATFDEFVRGETIVFTGDRDDALFVILSGLAKTRSKGDGHVLGAGDYFGELALIDGRPRSATVVAMSHVHVLKLQSRSVLNLARRNPSVTLKMLEDLATRLRRLEATRVAAT